MARVAFTIFAVMSLAGCASYQAPGTNDAATLKCSVKIMKIFQVDDDRTWSWHHQSDGLSQVQLSPGKHTIAAHVFMGDYYADCELWLVAVPLGQYELHYRCKGMRVAFWITDTATGLPVGGIKGSDDEPPDGYEMPRPRQGGATLSEHEV